jgi:toxin ParE1/3/4
MRIEIGAEARADLSPVLAYGLEVFGRETAEAYLRGLYQAIANLSDYPLAAPLHGFVHPPIRALSYRSHRVFYDVEEERVIVRRTLHKAMDASRWL